MLGKLLREWFKRQFIGGVADAMQELGMTQEPEGDEAVTSLRLRLQFTPAEEETGKGRRGRAS